MSTIAVNAITDANAGNTTSINGVTPNANNVVGKNLVINGAMQIAQRGTSVTGITGNGYQTVDRFKIMISAGTWTLAQDTDSPDGFANSLKYDCTTATASPNYVFLEHRMEGQMLQQLAKGTTSAKKITLSFYVKCNKTGDFQVNLRDKDNSRIIGKVVTISSANTWEKKTITFDGDTTGTLNNDNGESLTLEMFFDAGSSFNTGAVPTSWEAEAGTDRGAGVTLALADSTSNYINITGVQLEVGETATEFEHRPYGMELSLCQRYLPWFGSGTDDQIGIGYATGSTSWLIFIPWKVQTRVAPTGIIHGTDSNFNVGGPTSSGITCTALNFSAAGTSGGRVTGSVSSGLSSGQGTFLRSQNTSGYLYFTGCEL
jgi:hypothetical protein